MKTMKLLFILPFVAGYLSCGDSILPELTNPLNRLGNTNKAPRINSVVYDVPGGIVSPGMTVQITAEAEDPEGSGLFYSFSSESGSFPGLELLENGASTEFIAAVVIEPEEPVVFTLTVWDAEGLAVSAEYELGTGKPLADRMPVIHSINSDLGIEKIVPNMPIRITVEADDPDGDMLFYRFESEYGSFVKLTYTPSGVIADFYSANVIAPEQEVSITVYVTDITGLEISSQYLVGEGKKGPSIEEAGIVPGSTVIIGGRHYIKTSGPALISFLADSTGVYQVRVFNDEFIDPDTVAFDSALPYQSFLAGELVSVAVNSPSGSEPKLFSAGFTGPEPDPDRIIIIVKDEMAETRVAFTICYDGVPPESMLISCIPSAASLLPDPPAGDVPESGAVYRNLDTVVISSADNVQAASIRYTKDGSSPLTGGTVAAVPSQISISNGFNRILYAAIDAVGNVETASNEFTCTRDPFAPVITVTSPLTSIISGNPEVSSSYTLSWSADKNVNYTVTAGGNVIANAGNGSLSGGTVSQHVITAADLPAEGLYPVVISVMAANGLSDDDNSVNIRRDDTSPAISSITRDGTNPVDGVTIIASISIRAAITDTGGTGISEISVYIEDNLIESISLTTYPVSYNYTVNFNTADYSPQYNSQNGTTAFPISVSARDRAGNEIEQTVYIYIDNMPPAPPALSFVSPSGLTNGAYTNVGDVTVRASGTDFSAYRYRFDTDAWVGPFTAAGDTADIEVDWLLSNGSDDGLHSIRVMARDSAGNWQDEGNAAEISWRLDTTNPLINITSPANEAKVKSVITIAYSAVENGSGINQIEFRVNGTLIGSPTAPSGSLSYNTGTSNQILLIRADITDNVGNSGYREITVTSDNMSPQITVIDRVGQGYNSPLLYIAGTGGSGNIWAEVIDPDPDGAGPVVPSGIKSVNFNIAGMNKTGILESGNTYKCSVDTTLLAEGSNVTLTVSAYDNLDNYFETAKSVKICRTWPNNQTGRKIEAVLQPNDNSKVILAGSLNGNIYVAQVSRFSGALDWTLKDSGGNAVTYPGSAYSMTITHDTTGLIVAGKKTVESVSRPWAVRVDSYGKIQKESVRTDYEGEYRTIVRTDEYSFEYGAGGIFIVSTVRRISAALLDEDLGHNANFTVLMPNTESASDEVYSSGWFDNTADALHIAGKKNNRAWIGRFVKKATPEPAVLENSEELFLQDSPDTGEIRALIKKSNTDYIAAGTKNSAGWLCRLSVNAGTGALTKGIETEYPGTLALYSGLIDDRNLYSTPPDVPRYVVLGRSADNKAWIAGIKETDLTQYWSRDYPSTQINISTAGSYAQIRRIRDKVDLGVDFDYYGYVVGTSAGPVLKLTPDGDYY